MDAPSPSRFRENRPLIAIGAILLLAFAALALWGQPPTTSAPVAGPLAPQAGAPGAPTTGLDRLPAAADDTVVLSELDPGAARARNAAVAFAAAGPGKPRPFVFRGDGADRIRARDCLALAGMAEAGGGDADQRAVMQVVLNRVRHPAFAKTVCGVVFEGSQRATGCQFSFTCDGSLARRHAEASWAAARARADEMLGGATHAPVGNATHFHADYVYPWWSSQLDKVAQVGPHIFFRWRGFWGSRQALSARYGGGEPDPLALRRTAQAIAAANPLPTLLQSGEAVRSITAEAGPAPGSEPVPRSASPAAPGVHFVLLSGSESPAALAEKARTLCPGDRFCQVYGWSEDSAIPTQLPLSETARRELRFSFLPARAGNAEAIFFDCRLFPAPGIGACLPRARP